MRRSKYRVMLVRVREIPIPLPRSSFLECVNMTTAWTINVKKITGQILKVDAINGAERSVLYNYMAFVPRVRDATAARPQLLRSGINN